MKNLNYLNYFFIGIPVVLISLGFITNQGSGNLIGYGLLFTILTGLFQVVIGMKMLIEKPQDKGLQIYIVSVVIFFLTLFINAKILYSDILYSILIFLPGLLAIYFSILIYKKQEA
jgi:hypothetical protein